MSENRTKIILAEDDDALGAVVSDNLSMAGYEVILYKDGEEAQDGFYKEGADLLLLDVMMPKLDGFSLAESIRKIDSEVPIIFLTAKAMKEDKILGFQSGADDYITKPFSMEELQLRIEAVLKRYRQRPAPESDQDVFEIGQYRFEHTNVALIHNDDHRDLTQKEADLLRLLCVYKNQVLKRDMALKVVWGESDYFRGRSMDVFITRLRKYLNKDESLKIENVHGVGFRLVVP